MTTTQRRDIALAWLGCLSAPTLMLWLLVSPPWPEYLWRLDLLTTLYAFYCALGITILILSSRSTTP